jgi:ribosomal protein S3
MYRRPPIDTDFIQNLQTAIDEIHEKHPNTSITIQGDLNKHLLKLKRPFYNFLIENNLHTTITKRPELDSKLVAVSVARQIENRISYKRAIKMAIQATMRMNAEGIKIQISGRLNGAEMARSEHFKEGRIPLSTLRADIDYSLVEAFTDDYHHEKLK